MSLYVPSIIRPSSVPSRRGGKREVWKGIRGEVINKDQHGKDYICPFTFNSQKDSRHSIRPFNSWDSRPSTLMDLNIGTTCLIPIEPLSPEHWPETSLPSEYPNWDWDDVSQSCLNFTSCVNYSFLISYSTLQSFVR